MYISKHDQWQFSLRGEVFSDKASERWFEPSHCEWLQLSLQVTSSYLRKEWWRKFFGQKTFADKKVTGPCTAGLWYASEGAHGVTNLSCAVAGRKCGARALLGLMEICKTQWQWVQTGGTPCCRGSRLGSPVCSEHEKTENFHGEWMSVVFACPESVLPPPGNSTSFSL